MMIMMIVILMILGRMMVLVVLVRLVWCGENDCDQDDNCSISSCGAH